MTHLLKNRASLLSTAVLMTLCSLLPARTAHASSDFPKALKGALEAEFPGQTFCVPLCTACHNTTKGGPGDTNVFGHNLEFHGPLALGNANADAKVQKALHSFLMSTPGANDPQVNGKWDSDGDGVSDGDELMEGSSPSVAGPRGVGAFCSDLTYGCGARIAPTAPPVDGAGLLSAGLVLFGFAAVRRGRRTRSAR